MAVPTKDLLTSDRLPMVALLFGMASGLALVLSVVLIMQTWHRLGVAVVFMLAAVLLWVVGFHERTVWLQGTEVVVSWWVTLHRYSAKELKEFVVSREERYVVSRIAGTTVSRASRAPDRWRLTAKHGGHKVNLGSFVTAAEAEDAKQRLQVL